MNKVFDLYRYLKLSGFGRELEILKTALETTPEELEAVFPQLFRFYEKGRPTAMFGGVFAQINKYIEQGYITQQEIDEIQTFESLKQKMKELKTLKKETEAKFKYLNEYNIEQEFKDLAKEKKLSKEDFEFAHKSFIAENEDNHQLNQAINTIADLREKYRLLQEKINTIEYNEELLSRLADPISYKTLNGAVTEINNLMMDVNNFISGRRSGNMKQKLLNYYDYIYNGENKLNAKYPEDRKGKAKDTSRILYNDGNLAIVNSWSAEACQYWERGAVQFYKDGVVFNTCTSRVGGVHGLTYKNLYKDYSSYSMFQILKLENGEPKFYEGPNEMLTICFSINDFDSGFKMAENSSASVNANDMNIDEAYLAANLPVAYNFVKKYLSDDKNKALLLSPIRFFENKHLIPEDIFNSFLEQKARGLHPTHFYKEFRGAIPEDIFNSLKKEKAKELEPKFFFLFKKSIPEDIFDSLKKEKAKELEPKSFFYAAIPEDIPNSLIEEKAKALIADDFFHLNKAITENVFDSLVAEKAAELTAESFFTYKHKIPENVFDSLVIEKAAELTAQLFFIYKHKIPENVFDSLAAEKAKALRPYNFFDFKSYIPERVFNSLVEKKIKELDPKYFFDEEISERIPEDIFNSFITEKLKEYLLNSENTVGENIIKYLGEYLSAKDFFKHSDKFPKDIFNSFAEERAKEIDPDDFFKYRRKIPRPLVRSLIEEKAKKASPELIFERGNLRSLIKSPSLSKEDLKDLIISKEKELPSDVKLSYTVISPLRRVLPQEVFSDILRRRYEGSDSI